MQIERYKNINKKEYNELDLYLHQKAGIKPFPGSEFKFDSPEEKINNYWRRSEFWYPVIPRDSVDGYGQYFRYTFKGDFEGIYKIPLQARLNEDLKEYTASSELRRDVKKFQKMKLKKLRDRVKKLDEDIQRQQVEFNRKRGTLSDLLAEYLEKNFEPVDNYSPHFSGNEEGRKTHRMIELIGEVEAIYRGILRGNIFAYKMLLDKEFLPTKEELIEGLFLKTKLISGLAQKYLVVQMAIEHYKSSRGPDKYKKDEELIPFILHALKVKKAKVGDRTKNLVTPKGKIQPYSIAEFLIEEQEKTDNNLGHTRYSSAQTLVKRLKQVLQKWNKIYSGDDITIIYDNSGKQAKYILKSHT